MNLHPDLIRRVFDFIGAKDLSIIKLVSKSFFNEFKNYIYYRSASENVPLYSLDYMKEDNFYDKIPESIKDVIYKLLRNPKICIAGGFPTQLYLDRIPKETSDIDIYVLGGFIGTEIQKKRNNETILEYFYSFIGWFQNTYGIIEYTKLGGSIVNIKSETFPYILQFIFTSHHTLMEVLSSFDNSHNKCGIWLNKSYVCPDAEISRNTMTTYFYLESKFNRYKKARDLGFKIYGLTQEKQEYLDNTPYYPTPEPTRFTSLCGIYHYYPIFIKNWISEYTRILLEEPIELDVEKYDEYKNNIQVVKNRFKKRYDVYILNNTNICNLLIKRRVKLYLNPIETIKVFIDKECFDYDRAVKIKRILLEITRKGNGLDKVPEYILSTCCDIIGYNKYLEMLEEKQEEIFMLLRKKYGMKIKEHMESLLKSPYVYRIKNDTIQLYKYTGYSYRDHIKTNPEHKTAYNNEFRSLKKGKKIYCKCTFDTNSEKYRINTFGCWNYYTD